jgi:UDP-glucose 4-epimerase
MRILLTGGTGFIGRYLKQHLKHDVIAPASTEINLLDLNSVTEFLKSQQFDAVVHCAVVGRKSVYAIDPKIEEDNLRMFYNLAVNREYYNKFINFGSGAEFDIDTDICEASEEEIWIRNPKHSYGRSKNAIAKFVQTIPNFYNLRIFGCFGSSESANRLLKSFVKKCQLNEPLLIPRDRLFDMVSVQDLLTVVEAVLAKQIHDNDLNIVYNKKYHLSEIVKMYAQLHNLDSELIQVSGHETNSYTGNGIRLNQYQLPLLGLEQSLKIYNI